MSRSCRRLAGSVFRVAIITFLSTAMAFAIALFLGIVSLGLINVSHLGSVDITSAYRHFALPLAMVVMVIAFVTSLRMEIREARDSSLNARHLHRVA
jgi:TRAP-type C4-dicarboxylate transport system permease small subunit